MLEILEEIIGNTVGIELEYSKVYKFKSGIFDPIRQVIQGISFDDPTFVINEIKVYSVGGIRYTLIPPGTEIIIGYIGGNPGLPYLVGIDPNAPVVVSFTGIQNAVINNLPPLPIGAPLLSGPVTLIKNPAIP
jgi:hypothetical protein